MQFIKSILLIDQTRLCNKRSKIGIKKMKNIIIVILLLVSITATEAQTTQTQLNQVELIKQFIVSGNVNWVKTQFTEVIIRLSGMEWLVLFKL